MVLRQVVAAARPPGMWPWALCRVGRARPASWTVWRCLSQFRNEEHRQELKKESHKCVRMDATGELRVGRMTVRQLREASGAPLRDLLQLGLSGGASSGAWATACILPRKSAVLLHLGTMKAVISPKEALFFDADRVGVRRAVRRISEWVVSRDLPIHTTSCPPAPAPAPYSPLSESSESAPSGPAELGKEMAEEEEKGVRSGDMYDEPLPFELVVLEGVLRELCASYARRCKLYDPIVHSSLQQLNTASSDESDGIEGLHRLSAFDGALSGFASETSSAIAVLVDLLDSDEDMLALLMSEHHEADGPVDPARHAIVELLLETYHRRLVHVAKTIHQLRHHVSSTRDLARIAIDLSRNRIIRFNLYLSISAVALGTMTTVAGLFGMNLVHGLEETQGAFVAVSAASLAIGAGVGLFAQATLSHHAKIEERAQSAGRDRQTLEDLLDNLGTIEHIFDGDYFRRPLRLADVERLVEKATGRPTNKRELELIFEIFDHSGDGLIDAAETEAALGKKGDFMGEASHAAFSSPRRPPLRPRGGPETASDPKTPNSEPCR